MTGTQIAGFLRQFVRRFSTSERIVVALLVILIVGAGSWRILAIQRNSTAQPVRGGSIIEGVVGRPQIINPLYAQSNPVDRDISSLVYSGLVKIGRGREFLPDLASSWEVFDNGTTYIFHLRDDVVWHDGERFDAEDVAFTINVIQSESYPGVLRQSWQGIEATVINPVTVQLKLPSASTFFLSQATVGIIPTHIFAHLPVSEIGRPENNSKPIGTGPYQVASVLSARDSLSLTLNEDYYDGMPFIEKVVFYFFDTEKSLLAAVKTGAVTSAGVSSLGGVNDADLADLNVYVYQLPQYKAVFINQLGGNEALADKAVRQALALATNKDKIIRDATQNNAVPVNSPILPGFWGHLPDIRKYNFDFIAARDVLHKAGWRDNDQDGVLEKGDISLSFTLSFRDDSINNTIAQILASDWEAIGAEVTLNPVGAASLFEDVIRPRQYDALIFGQDLGTDSDPYVYWHSSQTSDPGLALSVMYDKDVDNNLEMARLSGSLNRAISYYHGFQNAFAELVPAVLLYQPDYFYLVNSKVQGVTSEINLSRTTDRFINISEWYVKSRRVSSSVDESPDIISSDDSTSEEAEAETTEATVDKEAE